MQVSSLSSWCGLRLPRGSGWLSMTLSRGFGRCSRSQSIAMAMISSDRVAPQQVHNLGCNWIWLSEHANSGVPSPIRICRRGLSYIGRRRALNGIAEKLNTLSFRAKRGIFSSVQESKKEEVPRFARND